MTIRRWLRRPGVERDVKVKLRRVRVADRATTERNAIVVVTTHSGLRIEGLTLTEIVALARELG